MLWMKKIPAVSASASRDSTGTIRFTIVNINPNKNIPVRFAIPGSGKRKASAYILTSEKITDINSFENRDHVKIETFEGFQFPGDRLDVDAPSKSVVLIELK